MSLTLFGIPNCQTVKKARIWLSEHQIDYVFHDFKKQGVSNALIQHWLGHCEISKLLNRSGMTFRNLSDAQKEKSQMTSGAIELLIEYPSMIKRPILDTGKTITLGFDETIYQHIFDNL